MKDIEGNELAPVRLLDLLQRTGCSLKDISSGSGVPYSTIFRIAHGSMPRRAQRDKIMVFAARRLTEYAENRKAVELAVRSANLGGNND